MKKLIIIAVLLAAGVLFAGEAVKPNVLFIAVDDLRPEINCYGAAHMVTPSLDRLAAQGMIFTQAYCQVPVCGASRASLLTGIRPTRSRFVSYLSHADTEMPEAVTLPGHFKNNGYTTISIGKIFHDHKDSADSWSESPFRPYDENGKSRNVWLAPENAERYYVQGKPGAAYECVDVPDEKYYDGINIEKSLEYLRRFKDSGEPFFLAVGLTKPHLPFCAPKKYWDMYPPETIHLPDNYYVPKDAPPASLHTWHELRGFPGIPPKGPLDDDLAKTLIRGYYACTSYADALIGRLLDELETLDLRDNTIIVLWGDHGWNLGEHTLWCKHCNYETSLRAPLMIAAPGRLKGAVSDSLVEFVDVYPTLCDLTGLDKPAHLQGDSLTPVLDHPKRMVKDAAYSRYNSGESVRTARYLYTEYYADKARTQLRARMLYDHRNDPDENVNVSEQPRYQLVVEYLSKKLAAMRAIDQM